MKKIIVFTDVHFCVLDGSLDFARSRFEAGLAHAHKYHPDAELLVLTGDLTNEGDVESFEVFKSSFDKCKIPSVLLLGNHDNRENFTKVFPEHKTDENGFVQQAIDTEHAKLVFLDTLHGPPYKYPQSHAGLLCDKRLEWLDKELASAGKKPVVIFMHHPPHKTGFLGMDYIRLINGPQFYDLLEKHNNVIQIMAGHVHRTISGSHRQIPFAILKSTQYQIPLLFGAVNTSEEVDEPPAYGVLLLNDDGVLVHTEDFGLTDYDRFIEG